MIKFIKFYNLLFILILLGCSSYSPQTRNAYSSSKASDTVYRVHATYLSRDTNNEYRVSKNAKYLKFHPNEEELRLEIEKERK